MKRFVAFFSSPTAFNMQSCNLLNSYDDMETAMAEMENIHKCKYTNDFKWQKETGFIFDLKENKYSKKDGSNWKDLGEIPDAYRQIINRT